MTTRGLIRRAVADVPIFRTSFMTTQGIGLGTFYTSGHYDFATADANLTQVAATQNFGVANEPFAGHAAIIAGGAGSAAGGAGSVEIEVSGTSISEAGVRTAADSEILVADITAMAVDQYIETDKKWLGTVVFTLKNASGSTQTTFSADFNYGHLKYTDMGDRDFIIEEFKIDGLAGASDAGFDVRLLHHTATGWTYAATGFIPGDGELVSLATEYGTESVLSNGDNFAYDRTGMTTLVRGTQDEGYLIEVTTTANNAIEYLNATIGVFFV